MVDTTYICCGRVCLTDRLEEVEKSLKSLLTSCQSRDYLDEILVRPIKQKRESLSALSGLLYLCRHARINVGELKLARAKNRKPYLYDSPYHISLSHSGGLFVCALSSIELGIDIETRKYSAEYSNNIAKRFFCEDEIKFISNDPEKNFIKVWTRKESYVKMYGSTLSQQISKFNTQKSEYNFFEFEYRDSSVTLCRPFECKTEIYTL